MNVITPSPLDGGWLQLKVIFMLLPTRGERVLLQSPCWAAISSRVQDGGSQ